MIAWPWLIVAAMGAACVGYIIGAIRVNRAWYARVDRGTLRDAR